MDLKTGCSRYRTANRPRRCLYPAHYNTAAEVDASESTNNSLIEATVKARPFDDPTGLKIVIRPRIKKGGILAWIVVAEIGFESCARVVEWAIDNKTTFEVLAHPSCLGILVH